MNDAEEAAGTRPVQVCQGCRIRHKKCNRDSVACAPCRSSGIKCVQQPTFRFRYDPKQVELAETNRDEQQPWAQHHGPLRFHDETPELQELYTGAWREHNWDSHDLTSVSPFFPSPLPPPPVAHEQPAVVNALTAQLPSPFEPTPSWTVLSEPPNPAQPFSASEAIYVRNFVDHMAQWTDVADVERTFELEVPRRAMTEPLLRHAICAFSARHFHRRSDGQEGEDGNAEALDHQNRCLELLIPAMSGGQITESILAAVAVLRQNEEMDVYDRLFHLEGCARILNMVPDFALAGGLGEAAAWLCLREDMYISLTTQSRMNVRLDSFRVCGWIQRGDDQSWASKMILNLAFLLSRSFGEDVRNEDLLASEAEIQEWDEAKPVSYTPIRTRARSCREGHHFPEIWTLAPHHAVGLQYYHISQIVLVIMKHRTTSDAKPYDHLLGGLTTERQIRRHLLKVVGLAISNPRAENTWYTARHCLSVWSGCLRNSGDQQATVHFLEEMGRRTGWRVQGLIDSIVRQWDDDSESS